MIFASKKTQHIDYHWLSEAASSSVTQSWHLGTQKKLIKRPRGGRNSDHRKEHRNSVNLIRQSSFNWEIVAKNCGIKSFFVSFLETYSRFFFFKIENDKSFTLSMV